MQVSANIQIDAPVETVFSVFSDIANAQERINGINKIEITSETTEPAVGLRWVETRTMYGKEATEEMWITEFDPNKSYEVRAESHGMKYKTIYTFEQNNAGTYVHMLFEGKPVTLMAKVFNIVFGFMSGSMKKELENDMKDLKKVCEDMSGADKSSESQPQE